MNKINTFKGVAYEILKSAGKPLHSDEITKIALQNDWLKTAGQTLGANTVIKQLERV